MDKLKSSEIEALLWKKSQMELDMHHKHLLQDFLHAVNPSIYCIKTNKRWLPSIIAQSQIIIYADARRLNNLDQFVKLLVDNPTQKIVINHISEITDEQFAIAQLFYHILDNQVYEYKGTILDFNRYTILMIQEECEKQYDDFYAYACRKMVRI